MPKTKPRLKHRIYLYGKENQQKKTINFNWLRTFFTYYVKRNKKNLKSKILRAEPIQKRKKNKQITNLTLKQKYI